MCFVNQAGPRGMIQNVRHVIRLRTRLRQLALLIMQFASRLVLSSRLRREGLPLSPRSVLLLAIYRNKNALIILPLIREAQDRGWEIRLWALDEIHPSLAAFSVGSGTGAKFPLLNSLLGSGNWSDFGWVVVADDDVKLERGSLGVFLHTAEEAGLSLAQPAHGPLSYRGHNINLVVPLSVAHLTTFVENGPIFAVHRSWFDRFFPFPDGYAMGWGLELLWMDLIKTGARLGIVDLVTMRHVNPIAGQYAALPELERVQELLRARGAKSIHELEHTLGVWRPWQRRPDWLSTSGPVG